VLVNTLLFVRDVSDGEKAKQGINCFKRIKDTSKLSQESKDLVSKEFKRLTEAKTMSSVVMPKSSSSHAAPAAQAKPISETMLKVDKLIAEWGESLPKDSKHSLLVYLATEQRDKV